MLKQTIFGVLCVLTGFFGGMQAISRAQFYAGGSVGMSTEYGLGSQPDHGSHDGCSQNDADLKHQVGTIFAGYRLGYVGAEVGSGNLFHMKYRADCPWNLFTQDFKGSYRYGRINGYAPLPYGFELVPFVGAAIVKYTNFEDANYRAPYLTPEHATNLTTGKSVSPLFGIGVQKNIDKWFVRGEFQQVNKVAEDYWTARGWHNTVQTVSIGLGRYFQ